MQVHARASFCRRVSLTARNLGLWPARRRASASLSCGLSFHSVSIERRQFGPRLVLQHAGRLVSALNARPACSALPLHVQPLREGAVAVLARRVHLEDGEHVGRSLGGRHGDPVLALDESPADRLTPVAYTRLMESAPLQPGHGVARSLDWWGDPALYEAMEHMTAGQRRPLPGVLDTSCVRTGLARQLETGVPPASLGATRNGTVRLFMERDTLDETCRRLPRFAQQLGVPTSRLASLFAREWLPHIRVVALPPALRELDTRAVAVRGLDADDYPAAALAALLSPCVLLTHDRKHFGPLGIQSSSQGVNAVVAALDVKVGEVQLQAVAAMPAAPIIVAHSGIRVAIEHMGPVAWVLIGLVIVGAFWLYQRQPQARKEAIKTTAAAAAQWFLVESQRAARFVQQSRERLAIHLVPPPECATPTAAVLRELATTPEPMSAQQLYDMLDASVRAPVASLRQFLHANKPSVFHEAGRGSFLLGGRCVLSGHDRATL